MSDWGRPPSSASLEWEYITKQVITTNTASVVFSGLNTAYRRFQLEGYIVSQASTQGSATIVLNQDFISNGNHYEYAFCRWQNIPSGGFSVSTAVQFGDNISAAGVIKGGYGAAFWFFVEKPSAARNARFMIRRIGQGTAIGGTPSFDGQYREGEWINTADLLSRIDIQGAFASGSRFVLSGARESL